MSMTQLDRSLFDVQNLAAVLETATEDTLHAADFGIVGLRGDGCVSFYNRYEQELAGLSSADVVGRDFFVDVAPCTNNFMVRERFQQAWRAGVELDEARPYTFSYRMAATPVKLRMLVKGSHSWLLVLKQ